MNFNTTNNTFRQLMGNGLSYRVPKFQRDYSLGSRRLGRPLAGHCCTVRRGPGARSLHGLFGTAIGGQPFI